MTTNPDKQSGKIPGLSPLMTSHSLAQRACDALKAYIVGENLAPGSPLPSERRLSEALDISRNVLRESLSMLVSEGIIVKRPGKGIFLRDVDQRALVQEGLRILEDERARYQAVREARAAVEIGAIGLVVTRINDKELQELEAIQLQLEQKLAAGKSFVREDARFHLSLLRAAKNDILLQWTPLVQEVLWGWMFQSKALEEALKSPRPVKDLVRVVDEHRAILEAVRRRDTATARQLLQQHFLVSDL